MPPIENNIGNNYNLRPSYNFGGVENGFNKGFDNGCFINGNDEQPFQYQINDSYVPGSNSSENPVPDQKNLAKFAAQNKAAQNKAAQNTTPTQNGNSNAETTKYKVQQGDSLYKILLNSGFSKKEIAEQGLVAKVARDSGLRNPNLIRTGQELTIPPVKGGNMATVEVRADQDQPITTESPQISTSITPRPLLEMR